MQRCWLVPFFAIVITTSIYSQSEKRSLSGKVIDAITKEPLSSVNIFFANTTIGTSSLTDGAFFIKGISSGKYDLVASFIGYKPFMLSLDFSDQARGFTKEIKLTIELEQEAKELGEITVKADTLNWAKNYADFKKSFLGETHNSKQCKILNPHDIHFYFDPKDAVLVAHSKKPIEVENLALGYKIYYYLYQFESDYRNGVLSIFGVPRYEELASENGRKNKVWKRERAQAYDGSVTHFMRALRDSALVENGFTVKEIVGFANPERPSDKFLNRKVKELREKQRNNTDSIIYYNRLKARTKEIEKVRDKILTGAEFLRSSAEKIENMKGKYQIVFDDKEEQEYLWQVRRKYTAKQKSIFHFSNNSLKIYANGYYEDVRSLLVEGYLSWHEKIANMLPLEYEPPNQND
jgi:hypothetical protein